MHGPDDYHELIEELRATKQILSFEVGINSLTDEGWWLLDRLESFWCEKLDGYVCTVGEGIYDHYLRRICNLEERPWRDISLVDSRRNVKKKELRSLDVFCLSDEPYDLDNIDDYFDSSGAFDEETRFTPPLAEMNEDWLKLEIDYQTGEEQISIYRYVKGEEEFQTALAETLEIQKDRLGPWVDDHLRNCVQLFSIVYHEPTLDQDADIVINNIAFNIAETVGGIVSIYHGFYDDERTSLEG